MPLCLGASKSVRTSNRQYSAWAALDDHTFWPLTMYLSPTSSARVRNAARSEPAFGSEKPWHQITPFFTVGRKRSIWSCVAHANSVAGKWYSEITYMVGLGALA